MYNRIKITKKECEKINGFLDKVGKKNPGLEGFTVREERNLRGDYGYDSVYLYKGQAYLILSVDGAHVATEIYKTTGTENILKQIQEDATK